MEDGQASANAITAAEVTPDPERKLTYSNFLSRVLHRQIRPWPPSLSRFAIWLYLGPPRQPEGCRGGPRYAAKLPRLPGEVQFPTFTGGVYRRVSVEAGGRDRDPCGTPQQ